eukprot:141416-Pyramimonas_sp.AAC.1
MSYDRHAREELYEIAGDNQVDGFRRIPVPRSALRQDELRGIRVQSTPKSFSLSLSQKNSGGAELVSRRALSQRIRAWGEASWPARPIETMFLEGSRLEAGRWWCPPGAPPRRS